MGQFNLQEALVLRWPALCNAPRLKHVHAELAHRTAHFLQAGAVEVCTVSEDGRWQVFDAQGEQPAAQFAIQLPQLAA